MKTVASQPPGKMAVNRALRALAAESHPIKFIRLLCQVVPWLCEQSVSAKCRSTLETARAKQLRTLRRSERECPRCGRKFLPKRIDGRYCSLACKRAAYRCESLFLPLDSLCFGLRACQKIRKEKIKSAPKRKPLKGNFPIYALGKRDFSASFF